MDAKELWPYSEEQERLITDAVYSFDHLQAFATTLIRYNSDLIKAHVRAEKVHESVKKELNLTSELDARSHDLTTLMTAWTRHVGQSQQTGQEAQGELARVVKDIAVILSEIKYAQKELKRVATKILKRQASFRNDTLKVMARHEKACPPALDGNESHVVDAHTKSLDPWLSGRLVRTQLHKMIDNENACQKKIKAALDVAAQSSIRITMKLYDLLNSCSTLPGSRGTTVIPPHLRAETHETITRANTRMSMETWTSERNLAGFPFQMPEIKVIHQGTLMVPAKWSFRKWTTLECIVTDSGYLHGFASKDKDFDAESNNGQFPKPVITIALHQPHVSVAVVAEKTLLSVFTIEVPKRELYIPNLFHSKKERAFDVFEFRAIDQDAMIDWVNFLETKIQSYLPLHPPSPIFDTADAIQERVLPRNHTLPRKDPRLSLDSQKSGSVNGALSRDETSVEVDHVFEPSPVSLLSAH